MKKYIYIIGVMLMGIMSACSNISEDERLIEVKPDMPEESQRNVLIEDFTGQRCVNCPKATEILASVSELYGHDKVIPVAIHCGPFGFAGNAKTVGLMTDTGKEYWNRWFDNSQGQPVARINRLAAPDDYNNWPLAIVAEMKKTTDVRITVTPKFDGKELTILAGATAANPRTAKLQLWIVEDNIVAMQSMPDGSTNREYVHNHVFRTAVNGTWGEDVNMQSTVNEDKMLKHSVTLKDDWKINDLSIVAFVYDDSGVLQAVTMPVVTVLQAQ